jgi:hypothetical protein
MVATIYDAVAQFIVATISPSGGQRCGGLGCGQLRLKTERELHGAAG